MTDADPDTAVDFTVLTARLDPPLVIVTAASQGQVAGCVVGFHSQCSIDPARYAVWISKANFTYRVALLGTHLVVHLLDATQRELADVFGGSTGDEVDKFAAIAHDCGPGGAPILSDCPNHLVLRRIGMWDDGGDHVCFVGEPVAAGNVAAARPPLRVSKARDIDAGHAAADMPG